MLLQILYSVISKYQRLRSYQCGPLCFGISLPMFRRRYAFTLHCPSYLF